ncbi:hypothetical protein CupriaWKF_22945 [Cupriavidus sp. WKF15]|uniref:hypothetical protein n=1 Tax=Cupriavidus sp. WKF15 TaxID=3032282 RepID=UPI0023E326B1|nr:hypothetical protein [Cupriavidus sp. WKF15]WER49964.1 hypothetical protein CupriaWKF_22945 [Cupriavidus sp. WKF15]
MPTWDYHDEPTDDDVVLVSWSVMEVNGDNQHFVGLALPHREGRVSSSILSFDAERRVGVTRSGRRYHLHGRPGGNVNSDYAWNNWRTLNGVTTVRDVTHDYLARFSADPSAGADAPKEL